MLYTSKLNIYTYIYIYISALILLYPFHSYWYLGDLFQEFLKETLDSDVYIFETGQQSPQFAGLSPTELQRIHAAFSRVNATTTSLNLVSSALAQALSSFEQDLVKGEGKISST